MDPEGAAVEQLYKKGTSLGRPWGAEQESSNGRRGQEGTVVKTLKQECHGSNSA